jgi:predicted TIM-barrel fold metal-dependent hydrolase
MTASEPTAFEPGLIDVHSHFVTDSYVRQATAAGHQHPDGMDGWPTWSAEEHLALMDRHGIATAMLSMSSPGVHFGDDDAARRLAREVNEDAAAVVTAHPDRFGFFASLPLPDVDGALAEIRYALDDLGADGVVLLSNFRGTYLGSPDLEPVLAELDRRRAVVFLHPTSPAGWEWSALGKPRPMIEYIFDTTRTVTDLLTSGALEHHPNMTVVVPHCGGALPVLADRIGEFMRQFLGAHAEPTADAVEQLRHRRPRVPARGSGPARARRPGTAAVRQRLLLDAAPGRRRAPRRRRCRRATGRRRHLADADHRQRAQPVPPAGRHQVGDGRNGDSRSVTSHIKRLICSKGLATVNG